ncbi:hypothetical protein M918_20955 [Clostridium sp. BL8]|nr:hypothetical protein M918_20955 [Clostridium sp. BL8]
MELSSKKFLKVRNKRFKKIIFNKIGKAVGKGLPAAFSFSYKL